MEYFRYLGIILGVYVFVAYLWIFFFTDRYKQLARKFIPEKRPTWYQIAGIVYSLLVIYTWAVYFKQPVIQTLILSLVLTAAMVKIYYVLFRYDVFREWALAFLALSKPILRTFAALIMALGLLMIAVGMSL